MTTHSPVTPNTGHVGSYTASSRLAADLQMILVDLIALHLQGKQAHWNVVGPGFRGLHLELDDLVDRAREASDTIAERMRALRAVPDGRGPTVVATASLEPYPAGLVDSDATLELISGRIGSVVDTIRRVHDEVDADDPTTADLLHAITMDLEKSEWMIAAEVRTPRNPGHENVGLARRAR